MITIFKQKFDMIEWHKTGRDWLRALKLFFYAFILLLPMITSGCVMPSMNPSQLIEGSDMKNTEKANGSDKMLTPPDSPVSKDVNPVLESPDSSATIMINPAETHQTIEGFGTSGCWWAQDVGTWAEPVKNQISDWLFDLNKGIGLTIYRFNAGAGEINEAPDPWRRVETFETAPGSYDWSRDAGSVDMMRRAVERGVDSVVIFANSPPGRMLKSGKTTGDDKGNSNLQPGMEDDFARYLLDIGEHFQSDGIPVKYISPVNEPQWNWKLENGQEGCHYEPQGVLDVGYAFVNELSARKSDIKLTLADSGKMWDAKYTVDLYRKTAKDPVFEGFLPHFSVHAYWSNEEDKKMLAAAIRKSDYKLPLWQSEWCQMEGGYDIGMDPALILARCVHEDLTILDCTSWQTWIAVSCYDYKDGLIHVNKTAETAIDMKRLWALGNWSRFVRPGYTRLSVDSPYKALLLSAWVSPSNDEIVLVGVNEGTESLTTALEGLSSIPAFTKEPVLTSWETSDSYNLEKVSNGPANRYEFPARSITTLVIR